VVGCLIWVGLCVLIKLYPDKAFAVAAALGAIQFVVSFIAGPQAKS
jgi:hypothetical protein